LIPDADEACLAKRYAPVLILHEKVGARGWPSSAEWFVLGSKKEAVRKLETREVIDYQLTPATYVLQGISPSGNQPEDPPIYTHVYPNLLGGVNIQYWYFFPYNGTEVWHHGDWEHVNLRLNHSLELDGVTFYHHSDRTWRDRMFLEIYQDYMGEHVVIHIAEASHASYPTDASCEQGGAFGSDSCPDGLARTWLPHKNDGVLLPGSIMHPRLVNYALPKIYEYQPYRSGGLQDLGERGFEAYDWEKFEGRWGSHYGTFLGHSSLPPRGPLFKDDDIWLEQATPQMYRLREER
jgi:hypothetical protein